MTGPTGISGRLDGANTGSCCSEGSHSVCLARCLAPAATGAGNVRSNNVLSASTCAAERDVRGQLVVPTGKPLWRENCRVPSSLPRRMRIPG